jgi:hypothetical protein
MLLPEQICIVGWQSDENTAIKDNDNDTSTVKGHNQKQNS